MTRITKEVLKKVNASKKIRNRLAFQLDKESSTIKRWISTNDIKLTGALALNIISEELQIPQIEILEGEIVNA